MATIVTSTSDVWESRVTVCIHNNAISINKL